MIPLVVAGALAGKGISMLGDAIATQNEKAGVRKASNQLMDAQKKALGEQLAGLEQLRAMYPDDSQIKAEYDQAMRDFENYDARVTMPEFDQSGYSSDKYLDPYVQYEADQAQRTLESSLAGQGGLYSGKAMQALQQQAQQFAGRNLQQARAEAMNQKQFDYNDYLRHFENLKGNAMLEQQRLANVFQNRGNARADVQGLIGAKSQAQSSNTLALGDIQANRTKALYGADSQMYNRLGNALGQATSQVVGSFAKPPINAGSVSPNFDADIQAQNRDYWAGQWDGAVSSAKTPF